jgi:predicted AlkP superfamily pyrophosphatase or phosphodiesterase
VNKTVVINAVGLTRSLIGPHTPRLKAFAEAGAARPIGAVLPAVTCSVQATYLTGTWPREHGIVGNGWYFRDECEVHFWKQANPLVHGPKVWDLARKLDARFTCANVGWWFNMYSTADFAVTPRPMYPADGRKIPDIWTHPASLRTSLQEKLGQFPLFKFWGPATSIESTQWIADAAVEIDRQHDPTLTLIYLPHLDYCLQRRGPDPAASAKDLSELDGVIGRLLDYYAGKDVRVMILSEYGISAVDRPVHLNRALREAGLLAVREELGRELLDAGESAAFAVADHQVAHIYVNDMKRIEEVRQRIAAVPGVERVLDRQGKAAEHIEHPRSGELLAIAEPGAWFTYYYWLDDSRRPDFATTVDIHRKPGYDPAELFLDPALRVPKAKIAWALLRRKLGLRSLLHVIGTDATLVRGSHGRPAAPGDAGPLALSNHPPSLGTADIIPATAICRSILDHLTIPPD